MLKQKVNRLTAVFLVGAMLLGLSQPVFAAETGIAGEMLAEQTAGQGQIELTEIGEGERQLPVPDGTDNKQDSVVGDERIEAPEEEQSQPEDAEWTELEDRDPAKEPEAAGEGEQEPKVTEPPKPPGNPVPSEHLEPPAEEIEPTIQQIDFPLLDSPVSVAATAGNEAELAAAVSSASNGDVIEITNDITLSKPLEPAVSITLYAENETTIFTVADVRHMDINNAGAITIAFHNVILDGNDAGGGIRSQKTDLTLVDAVIIDCYSKSEYGGAIYSLEGNLTVTGDTLLNGNQAGFGAGIYARNSTNYASTFSAVVVIEGATITNNTAATSGGGVYAHVGYQPMDISITDCVIDQNSAGSGGAFSMGSNSERNAHADIRISGTSLCGNAAGTNGGALAIASGLTKYTTYNVWLTDCVIEDNVAGSYGGAIRYQSSNQEKALEDVIFYAENCTFNRNESKYGAVEIWPYYQVSPKVDFIGCSFEDNLSTNDSATIASAGAVTVTQGMLHGPLEANFTDCRFTNNETKNKFGGAISAAVSTASFDTARYTIKDCLFEKNTSTDEGGAIYSGSAYNEVRILGNTKFIDNHASGRNLAGSTSGGGAVCVYYGSLLVAAEAGEEILFQGNNGGGSGGAIFVRRAKSVSITADGGSISFLENETDSAYQSASYGGGAVYLSHNSSNSKDEVTKITAKNGGSIFFDGNSSSSYGGAILLYTGDHERAGLHITADRTSEIEFANNRAVVDGGAIQRYNNSTGELLLAAEYVDENQRGRILFHDNAAVNGGAINVSYTAATELAMYRLLSTSHVDFYDNTAATTAPWEFSNAAMAKYTEVYQQRILDTAFDGLFTNAYNNYDINFHTYEVVYYANYDDAPEPASVSEGFYAAGTKATVESGSLFTRAGYTFTGWSATPDGPLVYAAEELTSESGLPDFTVSAAGAKFYAQWKEKEPGPEPDLFEVTYYANYEGAPMPDHYNAGSYESGETVTVQSGSLFSRSGYTFLGWSYGANNSTLAYTADDIAAGGLTFDMPDENVFLYAQWKADPVDPGPDPAYNMQYNANYNGAAGTPIIDENGPYTAGTTVTLKQGSLFSRSGYTFLGWSETSNGPVIYTAEQAAPATGRPTFTMPAGVKDLYAQWEAKPVDPGNPPALIYMPNEGARADGSTDPYRDESPVYGKSYDILYNDDASVNLGYMREGYTFLGWHETPDPDPDTTTGWYQEGSRIVNVDWEGDKTVYAIWVERDPKIPDYLVLYNANCNPFEGSVVDGNNAYYANSRVTVQGNQYFNPPDYFQFVGWNTEPDGSGQWYDPDDVFTMPAQNVTLYAQWELKPFHVYYDANAGSYTGSVEDTDEYVRGDTVTVKANGFSRSGYTFTGWSETGNGAVIYTAAQLASEEPTTFTMPGRNVYLYAQWSKDSPGGGGGGGGNNSRYNVIYHSAYATTTATDGSYDSGATVTVKGHSVFPSATIDVPADATFLGWSDSPNGTAVTYESGDTFLMPSRNVNLYAVYEVEDDMLNRDDHYAYVVGYPDGTVRPNDLITREEVTTIFFRLLTDASRDQHWQQVNDFEDVRYGRWSNNAISTMANAGIVNGYTDGSFRPQANITRAEVAVIAAQFDSSTYSGANQFDDISGHWAVDHINRAANRGWVNGYNDGTYKPDEYITRAEMMTLINQVLNRNPASAEALLDDMVRWPDNADTSVWYYLQVQEATNSHYYEMDEDRIHEWWSQLRPVRDWAAIEQKQ